MRKYKKDVPIGQKFNKLTILREVEPIEYKLKNGYTQKERTIEYRCDCGNVGRSPLFRVIHNRQISCGCEKKNPPILPRQNIIGNRYGSLLVVDEESSLLNVRKNGEKNYRRMMKCQCDCGNICLTRMDSLISGSTKSCGCLRIQSAKNRRGKRFNIGILDVDKLSDKIDKHSYRTWSSMLQRCYSLQSHSKKPTYQECLVCDEWLKFSNFKKWFDEHHVEGYELDKDIIVKGNKIYSPDTCCFVPPHINTILISCKSKRGDLPIGVSMMGNKFAAYCSIKNDKPYLGTYSTPEEAFNAYKVAKEAYIKEVADRWKGKIADHVYQALYNYQVEITD